MIVITCIKPETIKKIKHRGEGTIELISHQNVAAAEELRSGDIIFLTTDNEEDLRRGSEGIVVRVDRASIDYFRHSEPHADEWEIKRARIRINFVGTARVNRVVRGKVIIADVDVQDHILIG